ncbi:type II toxin-antitoxin system RelE/ParE family toxin [Candidatus Woesearchaeota archaeon]|nr:type II toxin-antitoxin system RelE/ParE family toxin [Candidatus Woesearchaeota archaeon]
MFSVRYSNQAKQFLKKTDTILVKRLFDKIETLRMEPFIPDTKKVEGSSGLFRVRVGDYRILYEVDHKNNLIGIVKIDKRSKVY